MRIQQRTSWLASSGASVVIHSHVKTEHQRAPFPRTPRRGNGDQSDAQQVRAARLLHRVRWIRVRFGHPPTSLKHGPTSPCITLAMVHGCSPCAFKASAMSWSAWDSNVHSDQIRACEKVCTRHDQWQLRRTAGHASVERRRAAAPALLMLASQHDCASSHVELF